MKPKKKTRKKALPADYGDATPEQVAKAFLQGRSDLGNRKNIGVAIHAVPRKGKSHDEPEPEDRRLTGAPARFGRNRQHAESRTEGHAGQRNRVGARAAGPREADRPITFFGLGLERRGGGERSRDLQRGLDRCRATGYLSEGRKSTMDWGFDDG